MSPSGWCSTGQHDSCPREFQRFFIDPRTSKVVWLDEYRTCECNKRGCECYVKAADRTKKRASRRKK